MQPQQFTAKLEERQDLNERFIQLHFELIKPHTMEFQAGQYVSIKVDEQGTRRSYSICSSPEITHGFELLVDLSPGGVGCQYLKCLKFGDQISFLGPMGHFITPENPLEDEAVMIATGSGIAPFRSMLADLLRVKQDKHPITLYWGMRHARDLFWLDEFQDLMDSFNNFKFHPVLSKPEKDWSLSRGRVTDVLIAQENLPKTAGYSLCGSQAMIEDVRKILIDRGVSEDFIHWEKFF